MSLGFWVFLSVLAYAAHVQYMAGHDTPLFTHKTDYEKAVRDGAMLEAERLIKQLPENHGDRNRWLSKHGAPTL